MLYSEFINKAINETIVEADNGMFYLEPMWRTILDSNELLFDKISDFEVGPAEVYEVLQLEVKKRNTINSKKPAVIDWLYELIMSQVEPAMLEQETDYLKNLTEYLKANKEATLKDEEWDKFKKI